MDCDQSKNENRIFNLIDGFICVSNDNHRFDNDFQTCLLLISNNWKFFLSIIGLVNVKFKMHCL